VQALTDETALEVPGIGVAIIDAAIQEMVTILLPTKSLQRVKQCLRNEARKHASIDMGVRTCLMPIIRINLQVIP